MGSSVRILSICTLWSCGAMALEVGDPLIVIADRGGVEVSTYFQSQKKENANKRTAAAKTNRQSFMSGVFPIRTTAMSVGPVGPDEGKKIPPAYLLTTPMFIVGDDPVSLRWLADNHSFLMEKSAVGLIVNIETPARMVQIQNTVGKGLKLSVAPGDDIAESLGIKHYPFYVDAQGVMR